jgi:hypothetical protein
VHRATKTVSNTTTRQLELGLEPWGEYLPFPPGQTFEVVGVVGEGDAVGELAVIEEGELVII